MADVSGETLVRFSVELPAGVTIKTRSTLPTLEGIGQIAQGIFGGTKTRSEYRSTTPTVLELEFPETLRSSVEAALVRLRTVGRL